MPPAPGVDPRDPYGTFGYYYITEDGALYRIWRDGQRDYCGGLIEPYTNVAELAENLNRQREYDPDPPKQQRAE